jgi:hypothetical protein
MNANFLLYLAAFLPTVWGVAHLLPTKNVVKGFGDISLDNQRVITMEWCRCYCCREFPKRRCWYCCPISARSRWAALPSSRSGWTPSARS